MRKMRRFWNTLHSSKSAVSNWPEFLNFAESFLFSHATSCAPCAKAKAACKPFDAQRAQAKAKAEAVRRSKARKTKQQTDAEWKTEVLRKLDGLGELQGLRKDVQRCHKLHSAISPPILHRFSRSQWLRKALEKTFRSVPVTSRGDQ